MLRCWAALILLGEQASATPGPTPGPTPLLSANAGAPGQVAAAPQPAAEFAAVATAPFAVELQYTITGYSSSSFNATVQQAFRQAVAGAIALRVDDVVIDQASVVDLPEVDGIVFDTAIRTKNATEQYRVQLAAHATSRDRDIGTRFAAELEKSGLAVPENLYVTVVIVERRSASNDTLMIVLCVCVVLLVILVGYIFIYYRRQALKQQQKQQPASAQRNTRWHGSFSGQEDGPVMLQLANEVQKAGGELTVAHFQREGWFEVWERKLGEAQGVIVVFSDKYRNRFTEALQKEARAILNALFDHRKWR